MINKINVQISKPITKQVSNKVRNITMASFAALSLTATANTIPNKDTRNIYPEYLYNIPSKRIIVDQANKHLTNNAYNKEIIDIKNNTREQVINNTPPKNENKKDYTNAKRKFWVKYFSVLTLCLVGLGINIAQYKKRKQENNNLNSKNK